MSLDKFRGRALAKMSIAVEAEIGIGAFNSGILFANSADKFRLVFLDSAGFAGLAFIFLLFINRENRIPEAA